MATVQGHATTLFDKIWDRHVVETSSDGESLMYIDCNLVHEGSFLAFDLVKRAGSRVRNPSRSIAFVDHFAPTRRIANSREAAIHDADAERVIVDLERNARAYGLEFFGLDDPRQGIMHVVAPELGLVLPGLVITGNDSHTCTNGAFGALAFGIGQSEVKQVFETQTVWRTKPKAMRVLVEGRLASRVFAKDVALAIICGVGAGGGSGYVIEYSGSCIRDMGMEARMTVCNMSVEAGARAGMIAPDETTFDYLAHCPRAPKDELWVEAMQAWKGLATHRTARFDHELILDVNELAPMVSWGTSLEQSIEIDGRIPQPAAIADVGKRAVIERSIGYMSLVPGLPIEGVPIDTAFVGSCTNSRIEDLRAAADVLKGRRVKVPTLISPGSMQVKRKAEEEGLPRIFTSAGATWGDASCSMCVGSNGDLVAAGQRCASTSPRNFEGRQGVGARTHVMSPAMCAAAAVEGAIVDVRTL